MPPAYRDPGVEPCRLATPTVTGLRAAANAVTERDAKMGSEVDQFPDFDIQQLRSAFDSAGSLASTVLKKADDTREDVAHKIG